MARALVLFSLVGAASAADCMDATPETNSECYRNAMWAKTTGIEEDKEWYKSFPFLTKESPVKDFQAALAMRTDERKGNCTMPCLAPETLEKFANSVVEAKEALGEVTGAVLTFGAAVVNNTNITNPDKEDGGMGIWKWVLIGMFVCCGLPCMGLMCSAFLCYESVSWIFGTCSDKKPEKKKKRAVKLTEAAKAPATAATPVATPQPVFTMAQPLMTAMPVTSHMPVNYAAAPVVHHAAPVYAAQPPMYTTAPVASTAYPAPVSTSYA